MRPQITNPLELSELFKKQFELCRVRSGETLVVLSDLGTRREYVQASFSAARHLGADIYEMGVSDMPSWTRVGIETVGSCKGAVEALKAADMIVACHVPLFTKWMKEVRAANTRVLMVVDHPDDLKSQMSDEAVKAAIVYGGKRLERAKTMRVTNAAGMDLRCELGEYPTLVQYGFADEPGRFDHWGAGHVSTFPNELTATGTVVVQPGDIVVLPYNRYVVDPIHLEISKGYVTSIKGGADARLMEHWLSSNKRDAEDREGYAVSHLGWGMNPYCRWDCIALNGDDPDRSNSAVRAFAGNFLFSTGPNTQGGGNRNTTGHYDVPMKDCSLYLDDELIIDQGNLVDPKMRVDASNRPTAW